MIETATVIRAMSLDVVLVRTESGRNLPVSSCGGDFDPETVVLVDVKQRRIVGIPE